MPALSLARQFSACWGSLFSNCFPARLPKKWAGVVSPCRVDSEAQMPSIFSRSDSTNPDLTGFTVTRARCNPRADTRLRAQNFCGNLSGLFTKTPPPADSQTTHPPASHFPPSAPAGTRPAPPRPQTLLAGSAVELTRQWIPIYQH